MAETILCTKVTKENLLYLYQVATSNYCQKLEEKCLECHGENEYAVNCSKMWEKLAEQNKGAFRMKSALDVGKQLDKRF